MSMNQRLRSERETQNRYEAEQGKKQCRFCGSEMQLGRSRDAVCPKCDRRQA